MDGMTLAQILGLLSVAATVAVTAARMINFGRLLEKYRGDFERLQQDHAKHGERISLLEEHRRKELEAENVRLKAKIAEMEKPPR